MSETRKPDALPVNVWLREGSLLYLLRPMETRHGRRTPANALTVRVEGDLRIASAEECEELTAKLHAFLASVTPLPDTERGGER